jgi:hypothetical protein
MRIKNGTPTYPLNDHLGTALMEASQTGVGATNQVYNYSPFGENLCRRLAPPATTPAPHTSRASPVT